jgi:hypothetical protein
LKCVNEEEEVDDDDDELAALHDDDSVVGCKPRRFINSRVFLGFFIIGGGIFFR